MTASGFDWKKTGGARVLVPRFFEVLGLGGGFSTRCAADGRDLDLDLRGGKERVEILENRRIVCGAMEVDASSLVFAEQVHSNGVKVVSAEDRGRGALDARDGIPGVDALVTAEADVPLAALSADCPLVLLADEEGRAVAVVHSGWRPTAAGVVPAALEALEALGVQSGSIHAAIGPAIGLCCYNVGEEVAEAFPPRLADDDRVFARREGRLYLDLAAAVERQLLDCGVAARRISTAHLCTSCERDLFFSYRREGARAGRFAGVIAIKPRRKT